MGENDISGLAVGAYAVTEVATSTYTPSMGTGCSGSIVASATSTCIITNTYISGGGSGGTQSDLSVTKSASETTANVGDSITYTVTVSNAGPATAAGVTVSDVLPSGLTYKSDDSAITSTSYNSSTGVWTIGTISSSASDVLHIVATVNSSAAGTTVTNTATVSNTNGDPNNENNSGSIGVTVNNSEGGGSPASDIGITKSADKTTPNVGDTVTYTITANDFGMDATNVVVNDSLPLGLTFVSTSTADTVGVYASSTGNWTIGKLSSTTPATLHISATVNSGLTNGTVINNVATVTAGDTSADITNNTSSAPVTVTIPTNNNGGGGSSGSIPTPTTSGGGGNGPIVGSYSGGAGGGVGNGPIIPTGKVLGASTSTTPNSCSQYLTAFISSGHQNDSSQVLRLQAFLDSYEGGKLKLSGVYDAATQAATEAFQQKYGSDVLAPWGIKSATGYVYLTTRKEVNTIYCHFTQNFPLTAAQQAIINASLAGTTGGSTGSSAMVGVHVTTHTGGSHNSGSGTSNSGSPVQTAAAGLIEMGTTSSTVTGSSSPASNPVNGIGNFFKHLFGH